MLQFMVRFLLVTLTFAMVQILGIAQGSGPVNRVLSLENPGDYVKLPSGILSDLSQVTIECWVKWNQPNYFSQPFGFGESSKQHVLAINNRSTLSTFQYFVYHEGVTHILTLPSFISLGQWLHIAISAGPQGMRLIVNGVLLDVSDFEEGASSIQNDDANFLGRSQWGENDDFVGETDEVRVWNRELNVEEIQARMFQRLSGMESGLVTLWNFDSYDASDATPAKRHGAFQGNARCVLSDVPLSSSNLSKTAILAGTITAPRGNLLPNANLRLMCGDIQIQTTTTDAQGSFRVPYCSPCNSIDLWCEWKELGAWRLDIPIVSEINAPLEIELQRNLSVAGSVTALDNSPQVGVSVQVLKRIQPTGEMEIIQKTQSDRSGQFQFYNLRSGDYFVRCYTGEGFHYYHPKDGPLEEELTTMIDQELASIVRIHPEKQVREIDFRSPPRKQWAMEDLRSLGRTHQQLHSFHPRSERRHDVVRRRQWCRVLRWRVLQATERLRSAHGLSGARH
jgi:hypothetical protein